jgi:hypothetical protein
MPKEGREVCCLQGKEWCENRLMVKHLVQSVCKCRWVRRRG